MELNGHYYVDRGNGLVEVWTIGHYATKGFGAVDRGFGPKYYPPRLVETITVDEAAVRFHKAAEEQAQEKASKEAKVSEEAAYEAYCAALPNEILGFRRGHIGRAWELEDNHGNYVLSVPKNAAREGWSVEKLSAWVDEQTAEGYGD